MRSVCSVRSVRSVPFSEVRRCDGAFRGNACKLRPSFSGPHSFLSCSCLVFLFVFRSRPSFLFLWCFFKGAGSPLLSSSLSSSLSCLSSPHFFFARCIVRRSAWSAWLGKRSRRSRKCRSQGRRSARPARLRPRPAKPAEREGKCKSNMLSFLPFFLKPAIHSSFEQGRWGALGLAGCSETFELSQQQVPRESAPPFRFSLFPSLLPELRGWSRVGAPEVRNSERHVTATACDRHVSARLERHPALRAKGRASIQVLNLFCSPSLSLPLPPSLSKKHGERQNFRVLSCALSFCLFCSLFAGSEPREPEPRPR